VKYQLVCFDFWDTLYTSSRRHSLRRHAFRVEALIRALADQAGCPDRETVSQLMLSEWRRFTEIHVRERRTPANRERIAWMVAELSCGQPGEAALDDLLEALEESLFVDPPVLVEGARALLQRLSQEVPLAIISDTSYSTGRTLRRLLEKSGILRHFAATTFSDEVGRAKPHPSMFQHTLETFDLSPGQAVHIGDREETDVAGAKDVGLDAILFLGGKPGAPVPVESRADCVAIDYEDVSRYLFDDG
jgi:HAD superfamily hydrolase (TIGR01549 family)